MAAGTSGDVQHGGCTEGAMGVRLLHRLGVAHVGLYLDVVLDLVRVRNRVRVGVRVRVRVGVRARARVRVRVRFRVRVRAKVIRV